MKKLGKGLFPLLFLLILSGCATTTFNPATGRREMVIYTREQEIALGQAVARRIEEKYGIVEGEQARRVERIGRKVAFVSSRIALPFTFKVLDREDLNALALPGGPVYITRALVEELNDDELATVLGHEIAHITARHGVKRLQAHRFATLLTLALMVGEDTREAARFTSQALNIIMLGYSREEEFWTDRQGARYAYRAGFDPRGMISVLEKLQEEEKERGGRRGRLWLSTHPPLSERIASLEEYLKTSLPDREK